MLQEGKLCCKACQSANIYYGKRGWIRAGERGHLAARTEEHSVPQDENSLSNVVTPRGICLGGKKGKKIWATELHNPETIRDLSASEFA